MIKIRSFSKFSWLSYLQLMRLDKPIGILLLGYPVLWALWISHHGRPSWRWLSIFVLGIVLTRSLGCVINDIADREFDQHVSRTRQRPLTSGSLTLTQAWKVFGVLLFLTSQLLWFLDKSSIQLAGVAFLCLSFYPFTKRFFICPQLILAITFYLGVLIAFMATSQHIPVEAWYLYLASICWALAFDTEYALADREDDRKLGLHSSALWVGRFDRLFIGIFQIGFMGWLGMVGQQLALGFPFWIGLGVTSGLLIHQQKLIKERQPHDCFQAFLNNHWIGLVVWIGIMASFNSC